MNTKTEPMLLSAVSGAGANRSKTHPKKDMLPKDRLLANELILEQLSVECDEMKVSNKEVRKALFGDIDDMGVCERLRRLETEMGVVKKVAYAILLILLGLVVTQLYNILLLHPTI